MNLKEKHLVVTANSYTTAKHELTLNEEKLIFCAIVAVREFQTQFSSEDFVQVDAHDFAKLTNIDNKSAYRILRQTAESLEMRKGIFYEPDPLTGKPSKLSVPMVTGARYVEGAGILRLRFSPEMLKYFVRLDGAPYTSHELGFVTKLSTQYAMRLYRLFQMERFKARNKPLEMTIEYLRELMVVGDKYNTYSNFKRRVIDESLEQINDLTEIFVSYEPLKRGRDVIALSFLIEDKTQPKDGGESKPIIQRKSRIRKTKAEIEADKLEQLRSKNFDKFESEMFFKISKNYKEITREFVFEVAISNSISVLQALVKIDAEYRSADEFQLEKEV
jgi:plasmid replication initiation protein